MPLFAKMKSYIPDTDISVKIKKNGSEQSTLKSYVEMFINMKKMAKDIWDSSADAKNGDAFDDIGEIMNGLVVGKENGYYLLRSYWNAPDDVDGKILFSSNEELKEGDIVNVKIKESYVYDLYGEIVK